MKYVTPIDVLRTSVDIDEDHERIHKVVYGSADAPFCPARSQLIRTMMLQRSQGMLPNDTFDNILAVASNPNTLPRVFNFFQIRVPEELSCA